MPKPRLLVRSLLPLPLVATFLLPEAPEPSRERWSGPADLLILTREDLGRPGFATLLALYPALGDGDVYDFYLDTDGDPREEVTFRFRAGEEDFRVEMIFGPTGSGQSSNLLTRAEDGARAFAYQAVESAEIPGCGTGRLYVGAGRMPLRGVGTLVALELPETCLSFPGLRPKVSAGRLAFGGRETGARILARPARRLDAIDPAFPHLAPGLAFKAGCCSGPHYLCFYYAMVRAGFTPAQTCSTAISGTGFGTISLSLMPQAQIVDWGSHAGYIKSSTSSTITTDEFNRSGSCAVSSHTYSSPSWGDGVTGAAVRAWVLRPGVPGLSSPANGATGVGPTVTLSWGGASLASAYRVDYTTNSSFSTYSSQQVSGTSVSLSLAASTTYWWRVQSLRGPYGGSYVTSSGTSTPWSFTTAAPCPSISVPSISPANDQGHPKLTWTAVSGADKYKIYRATDSQSYSQIAEVTGTSWTDQSSLLWTFPPALKTTKYYKIKAVNNGPGCNPPYETGFSIILSFTCNAPEIILQ